MGGTLAMGNNNITLTGAIGATGARASAIWATDLTVTNSIAGSITGNAATASAVAASALTGTTLASGVTGSSLTSVGTLTSLNVGSATDASTGEIKTDRATAVDVNHIFSNSSITNAIGLYLQSGNGTTSAKYSVLIIKNNDTNGQYWGVGTTGSDIFGIRDYKNSTTLFSIAPNDGVTVTKGLNVGSATGAGTGQIRTESILCAHAGEYGFTLKNNTFSDNNFSLELVNSIEGAGKIGLNMGAGGNNALDTNLYRDAANSLKTDDNLTVALGLNVGSATGAGTGQILASVSVGASGTRIPYGYFTDLSVTNKITGSISGNCDGTAGAVVETGSGAKTINTRVVAIGDWNMDSTSSHTVTLFSSVNYIEKVVGVDVQIKNDSGTISLNNGSSFTGGEPDFHYSISVSGGDTNIDLYRLTGGEFDSTDYNSTSYNRGCIIVWYYV
jgi:hypothetical protein